MATTGENRAKKSSAKDWLGLMAVVFSILALMYLLIENYMGYTGIKSVIEKEKKSKKIQKLKGDY